MSKYLTFEKQPRLHQRKTDTWKCFSKRGGSFLGTVKWYSPWRRLTFHTEGNTIFDDACLNTIGDFIKARMRERI